jgi:hypothetical protein
MTRLEAQLPVKRLCSHSLSSVSQRRRGIDNRSDPFPDLWLELSG